MNHPPRLADALKGAEKIFDRAQIRAAVASIADAVLVDYRSDETPPLFLTVMNGGLPFAAELALALGDKGLDIEMDYLHATRYRGETQGSTLTWQHYPRTALEGRRVLLVDDILDEGHTLLAVKQWCEGEGARDVRIAALAVKPHGRVVDGIKADYSGLEVPDRYVFGYGMDYYEQGRNLPAIYALKD